MLTREQIKKIAVIDNCGLGVVERDYVQQVFLSLLYSQTEDFVFKGGTCLKIAYKLNRYSEDLDFNFPNTLDEGMGNLESIVKKMEVFGISALVRNKKGKEKQGFGFDISYKGPLYNGRDASKGKIRVDASLRKEDVKSSIIIIMPGYEDIRQYNARCISLEDAFAEKIRALIIRGKPRDLYDVWFLLSRGEKFNENAINEKLKLYSLKFDKESFKKKINEEKKSWNEELQALLPKVPDFDEVKRQIINQLG